MERKREDRIMFLLGIIAGLVAVAVVELGAIDWALFQGFEIQTEQVTNE